MMKRHPPDANEYHDEAEDAQDADSLPDLESKLKSISRLPTWNLLVTLCSESLFYVGAWILALYVLYIVSQARVHTIASSRGAMGSAPTSAVAQTISSYAYEPGLADAYATRGAEFEISAQTRIAGPDILPAFNPVVENFKLGKEVDEHHALLRGASAAHDFPPLFPPLSQPRSSWSPTSPRFEETRVQPLLVHSSSDLVKSEPAGALLRPPVSRPPPAHAALSLEAHSGASPGTNEVRCRDLRKVPGVVPGKSWGKLTKALQREWMDQKCDRYFCKPNRLEGKGVYKCEPV
jgi:hypothetical protein